MGLNEIRIRVAEMFVSVQGEGALTGTPMVFVRFSGCSVAACQLHPSSGGGCDADWKHGGHRSVDSVVNEALDSGVPWLCITGGEPLDQRRGTEALVAEWRRRGGKVMIQTSGVHEVGVDVDWLVVSPKGNCRDIAQRWGHELKVLDEPHLDVGVLRGWALTTSFHRLYVQPVWRDGGCDLDRARDVVQSAVAAGAGEWRLSVQMHKYAGWR